MKGPTNRDIERMNKVKPQLVTVISRAIAECPLLLQVSEGVRTLETQKKKYAQGRTTPGPKVTWTMNSKHLIQPDGFGHAVDLVPIVNGKVPWNDQAIFDQMGAFVLKIAKEEGVAVKWGRDWDMDGNIGEKGETDSPHFEIVK